MCEFFGVSRAAYYARVKQSEQFDRDAERMQLVQEAYEKSRKTYGYRRLCLRIRKNKGISINHKAILRMMSSHRIHAQYKLETSHPKGLIAFLVFMLYFYW
jgi:hypothetical protein